VKGLEIIKIVFTLRNKGSFEDYSLKGLSMESLCMLLNIREVILIIFFPLMKVPISKISSSVFHRNKVKQV